MRLKTGSLVEESWWTSFLVGVPRSQSAGVGFFEDDHATALDARVVGIDGGGDDVGEAHVGDEAAALVDLQHRFLAVLPLGDAHLAAQHAGFDADKRDRLGEGEGGADLLAVFAGLGRSGQRHVVGALLRRAALVDGGEAEVAGQAAGGGAGIHPGQLEGDQGQGEVLRAFDEAAVLRVPGTRR